MNFPVERPDDKETAREAFKRNGCKSVRFEKREDMLIAHGYIGRMEGEGVEEL